LQGVHIASDADGFIRCCDKALKQSREGGDWLAEADLLLSATSWATTQARMSGLIEEVLGECAAQKASALMVAAE